MELAFWAEFAWLGVTGRILGIWHFDLVLVCLGFDFVHFRYFREIVVFVSLVRTGVWAGVRQKFCEIWWSGRNFLV